MIEKASRSKKFWTLNSMRRRRALSLAPTHASVLLRMHRPPGTKWRNAARPSKLRRKREHLHPMADERSIRAERGHAEQLQSGN